ncbi:hypothetical protein [Botrimarina mediterranea]|uniref:hypothetical protein n=1 Tax=Botrimarina mediterranea TaxID=2528022 RepID=UPI0011A393FA|nr:hypothetical protein [Botrimarina mediterranea]
MLLVVGAVWLWSSPASYQTVERLALSSPGGLRTATDWWVAIGVVLAAATLLATAWGLLRGSPRQRSIAGYLTFTALVGGWLALVTGWEAVYDWGQARRVLADLPAFEAVAQRLDADWPTDDGTAEGFGPFMAYPKGRPTCLLLLGQAKPPGGSLQVSAVERSDGAVRFELSGAERPAWVVWRAEDAPAAAFASGLGGEYAVASQRRLAPHWWLVRYKLMRASPDPSG